MIFKVKFYLKMFDCIKFQEKTFFLFPLGNYFIFNFLVIIRMFISVILMLE